MLGLPAGLAGAGSATGTAGFFCFLRAGEAAGGFLVGVLGAARLAGVLGAARRTGFLGAPRLAGVLGAGRLTGFRAAARLAGELFEAALDARAGARAGFLAGFLGELTREPIPAIRTCLQTPTCCSDLTVSDHVFSVLSAFRAPGRFPIYDDARG
jgi:hypothetical protein